jgi:methylase of polypeptide subunit release factors
VVEATKATGQHLDQPLRLGAAADFARVESALRAAGFDEATVCGALGIAAMSELGQVKPGEANLADLPATCALLCRLFLFLEAVPCAEVERALDAATLDALLRLDVLRRHEPGSRPGEALRHGASAAVSSNGASSGDGAGEAALAGERYTSSVALYPVSGFWIASDRGENPAGSPLHGQGDTVFPAIHTGTLLFLRLIPESPAADALDLCAGTGIGAFLMSRQAGRVVSADVTARATHFAAFNRALNRCDNVEVVQGDLYAPVRDRTFDRIVAHPPYVPSVGLDDPAFWRDGGETGEALLQRIVAELPRRLRPGGTCYLLCLGHDTREAPFEQRARPWLGECEAEFDIMLAVGTEIAPDEFVASYGIRSAHADAVRPRLREMLERMETTALIYGALVVHRRATPAARLDEPGTARVRLGALTTGDDFERAFRRREQRARPEALAAFARATVRLSPHLRVTVRHTVREGLLVPTEFLLECDRPFPSTVRADEQTMSVLAALSGTPAEAAALFGHPGQATWPSAGEDLVRLAMLVERGFVEMGDPDAAMPA